MSPYDVDGLAKSEDPDQTAPLCQSDLGLHCLPDLSVRKLRIITVKKCCACWFVWLHQGESNEHPQQRPLMKSFKAHRK